MDLQTKYLLKVKEKSLFDILHFSLSSSMCNSTNLPNFILMVNTFRLEAKISEFCCALACKANCKILKCFRIIVLTYKRPRSLLRLLKSLENSHYNFSENNPRWRLILEIRIDGGGGEDGRLVENVARNFRFSHGEKIIHKDCSTMMLFLLLNKIIIFQGKRMKYFDF